MLKKTMGLEVYLKEKGEKYLSLYKCVRQAAEEIWREPRLGWYTDHGIEHSKRVVDLLDQLCANLLADERHPLGLRPDEVFLLLAAAWLHDIGMQDLSDLNSKPVDQLAEAEWDKVRIRHPVRTQEIIAASAPGSPQQNPFLLGLETAKDIHIPLSLICKGHGSSYFDETTRRLNGRTFNFEGRSEPVRGALLTSLLLFADELDLHCSRAVFKANYPLSNVSELHYFRHHFVNHVEVVKLNQVDKQIKITLALPEKEQCSIWVEDLQSWLEQKLKTELNRIDQHIQKGFAGLLKFYKKKPIVFTMEVAEDNEKKLPSLEVINLLRRENTQVMDWKEAAEAVKKRFVSRLGGTILINGSVDQGSEQFYTHLSLLLTCQKDRLKPAQNIVSMDFRQGDVCGTLERIAAYLYESLFQDQISDPAEVISSLLAKVRSEDLFCTVFLQNYDNALPKDWEKLTSVLTDVAICEHFLFVVNTEARLDGAQCFKLPEQFSDEDMVRYFEKMGHCNERAKGMATTLRDLQNINNSSAKQVLFVAASLSKIS